MDNSPAIPTPVAPRASGSHTPQHLPKNNRTWSLQHIFFGMILHTHMFYSGCFLASLLWTTIYIYSVARVSWLLLMIARSALDLNNLPQGCCKDTDFHVHLHDLVWSVSSEAVLLPPKIEDQADQTLPTTCSMPHVDHKALGSTCNVKSFVQEQERVLKKLQQNCDKGGQPPKFIQLRLQASAQQLYRIGNCTASVGSTLCCLWRSCSTTSTKSSEAERCLSWPSGAPLAGARSAPDPELRLLQPAGDGVGNVRKAEFRSCRSLSCCSLLRRSSCSCSFVLIVQTCNCHPGSKTGAASSKAEFRAVSSRTSACLPRW